MVVCITIYSSLPLLLCHIKQGYREYICIYKKWLTSIYKIFWIVYLIILNKIFSLKAYFKEFKKLKELSFSFIKYWKEKKKKKWNLYPFLEQRKAFVCIKILIIKLKHIFRGLKKRQQLLISLNLKKIMLTLINISNLIFKFN